MIYRFGCESTEARLITQRTASKEQIDMSTKRVSDMTDDEIRELAGAEDPTAKLNYQIAEMIADTFGRAVEDFDIELADQIIAKVREAQPGA